MNLYTCIHFDFNYPPINLFLYQSICPSIYVSIHRFYLFIYLSINQFIYLSIYIENISPVKANGTGFTLFDSPEVLDRYTMFD